MSPQLKDCQNGNVQKPEVFNKTEVSQKLKFEN